MRRTKKSSLTTRYVLVVGALLLITNIILGSVLMRQSTTALQGLIRKNMLDISNTAAGLLDGDALGTLTEEDVGGPVFNDVLSKLSVFQANNDIAFIYAVRQVGEDEFVFTVDPDPVNPGAFGDPVLVTEALRQAAKVPPGWTTRPPRTNGATITVPSARFLTRRARWQALWEWILTHRGTMNRFGKTVCPSGH